MSALLTEMEQYVDVDDGMTQEEVVVVVFADESGTAVSPYERSSSHLPLTLVFASATA